MSIYMHTCVHIVGRLHSEAWIYSLLCNRTDSFSSYVDWIKAWQEGNSEHAC